MITVLHGDDVSESRKRFVELKQASEHPIILDGPTISLAELIHAFSTDQLFPGAKNILIENFFSKRKLIAKETKEIIEFIQKSDKEQNIVFWESKKLTPSALKAFPKAKIFLFSIPQTIFKFIDSISPKNGTNLIKLFHNALEQNEPEQIFFMMVRQLRILLSLSLGSKISESQTLKPWQRTNLSRQLGNFSIEQLKSAYKKLFFIDLEQKTGKTSLTLTQAVDIFLLNL